MKKLLLVIILGSVIVGCRYVGNMGSGVVGSGVRKSEQRDVAPFTSILTEGAYEIEIVSQQPQSLLLEGDDNVLPLVSTAVANGVLHISSTRSYSTSNGVRIKISVPNIEGVSANGAGTIDVSRVKNDKFEIDSNGAPSIKVSGETKSLRIDANGAGKIDTHKLRASEAVVDSKGVSKVELHAKDKLDVTVSGPSQVIYEGDPVVNRTVNGPGSVEKRQSSGA